jgi:hypothetical protein
MVDFLKFQTSEKEFVKTCVFAIKSAQLAVNSIRL